jgi:hypothetical protein
MTVRPYSIGVKSLKRLNLKEYLPYRMLARVALIGLRRYVFRPLTSRSENGYR